MKYTLVQKYLGVVAVTSFMDDPFLNDSLFLLNVVHSSLRRSSLLIFTLLHIFFSSTFFQNFFFFWKTLPELAKFSSVPFYQHFLVAFLYGSKISNFSVDLSLFIRFGYIPGKSQITKPIF